MINKTGKIIQINGDIRDCSVRVGKENEPAIDYTKAFWQITFCIFVLSASVFFLAEYISHLMVIGFSQLNISSIVPILIYSIPILVLIFYPVSRNKKTDKSDY